jgi:hypothetical protein
MILPSQARDTHRKTQQKRRTFCRDPAWLREQDQHYAWSTNWGSHPPGEGRMLTPNITVGRNVLGLQQFP